jgi:hypothetical protein
LIQYKGATQRKIGCRTFAGYKKNKTMQSIEPLLIRTHKAAASLRNAADEQIIKALQMLADAVEANIAAILEANKLDVSKQDANDPRTGPTTP